MHQRHAAGCSDLILRWDGAWIHVRDALQCLAMMPWSQQLWSIAVFLSQVECSMTCHQSGRCEVSNSCTYEEGCAQESPPHNVTSPHELPCSHSNALVFRVPQTTVVSSQDTQGQGYENGEAAGILLSLGFSYSEMGHPDYRQLQFCLATLPFLTAGKGGPKCLPLKLKRHYICLAAWILRTYRPRAINVGV